MKKNEFETTSKTKVIFEYNLIFTCYDFDDTGQWLDTDVILRNEYLMTIAGNDIDNFMEDFKKLYSHKI